jgi:hypothetical protein
LLISGRRVCKVGKGAVELDCVVHVLQKLGRNCRIKGNALQAIIGLRRVENFNRFWIYDMRQSNLSGVRIDMVPASVHNIATCSWVRN